MEWFKLFSDILKSDAGSFALVFSLFTSLVVLIWKVSYFHTKYSDIEKLNDKFENKFTQLEDKFEKKIDRLDSKFESKFTQLDTKFDAKFNSINDNLSAIKAFIELQKDKANPMGQRQSPIKLTEIGKQINKEISADSIVDKYWDFISEEVNKKLKDTCNPYDIQVSSFEVGDKYQSFISKEELDLIKINAYNHGYDLTMYELLFGIIIRDRILKEKNISTEEIDQYDPNL